MRRSFGLDVGTKTVGVAVSDALGMTAQPVTTLRRTSLRADLTELRRLAEQHGVEHAVVGLPLNMDGSEGPSAAEARRFGDAVTRALGIPVDYWDERLTTAAANRILLEADVSRAKRRAVVDRLAAALILQGWLESRQAAAHRDEP
ncbi:MAG TPA: Holliday junction resolvase RuvX [Myxococcaceae bacterium]|nr:Holliday junction resolvase RuvX [Myxococcaceae bacterium]